MRRRRRGESGFNSKTMFLSVHSKVMLDQISLEMDAEWKVQMNSGIFFSPLKTESAHTEVRPSNQQSLRLCRRCDVLSADKCYFSDAFVSLFNTSQSRSPAAETTITTAAPSLHHKHTHTSSPHGVSAGFIRNTSEFTSVTCQC